MSPEKLSPTITIDQPQLADAEELARMHGQSWLDTYPSPENGVSLEYIQAEVDRRNAPEGIARRQHYIQKGLDDPQYYLRVGRDGSGRIIGFVDGYMYDNYQELKGLYVDKTHHGTGVARQLTQAFFDWADDLEPTELEVATYNDRAQAFYKKLGFEIIPGSETKFRDVIPIIKMRREPSNTTEHANSSKQENTDEI